LIHGFKKKGGYFVFLKSFTAKGKKYIYLYSYVGVDSREIKLKKLYAFGRSEIAINKMRDWKRDFSKFPVELKEIGCKKADLLEWIVTIETGVTKTGKAFRAAV